MLLLSAGRECTALFTSYHWATEKPRAMLRKYEVRARGGGAGALRAGLWAARRGFLSLLTLTHPPHPPPPNPPIPHPTPDRRHCGCSRVPHLRA